MANITVLSEQLGELAGRLAKQNQLPSFRAKQAAFEGFKKREAARAEGRELPANQPGSRDFVHPDYNPDSPAYYLVEVLEQQYLLMYVLEAFGVVGARCVSGVLANAYEMHILWAKAVAVSKLMCSGEMWKEWCRKCKEKASLV